jgi:hypothetical protein
MSVGLCCVFIFVVHCALNDKLFTVNKQNFDDKFVRDFKLKIFQTHFLELFIKLFFCYKPYYKQHTLSLIKYGHRSTQKTQPL